jgi:hypothetical protein
MLRILLSFYYERMKNRLNHERTKYGNGKKSALHVLIMENENKN